MIHRLDDTRSVFPEESLHSGALNSRGHRLPVVLGSSLTGLLVSRALARDGIEHILVGGERPPLRPRLGESMNEGAAIACWDLLGPEFRPFFYPKSHVSIGHGDMRSLLSFADPNRQLERTEPRDPSTLKFLDVGPRIVHVDRAGLDPALYDEVIAHPTCRFIRDRITSVDYRAGADRVERIILEGEGALRVGHVFDATGATSHVPRAAGLSRLFLTRRQRVVWRHRHRGEADAEPGPAWWGSGTNIVRLDQVRDGVDGIAWIIPLGRSVSMGLSVDDERYQAMSPQALIDMLDRACARFGLPVDQAYPQVGELQALSHRYSMWSRAHGANWLLAGGTFGQVWFPTSTGVSTAAMAAYLASSHLRRPREVGEFYEQRFRSLLGFHYLVDDLVQGLVPATNHALIHFWSRWLLGVMDRVPYDIGIASGSLRPYLPVLRGVARVLRWTRSPSLAGVGFTRTRVEPIDGREPFAHYFRPGRFILGNLVGGIGRYVASSLHDHHLPALEAPERALSVDSVH